MRGIEVISILRSIKIIKFSRDARLTRVFIRLIRDIRVYRVIRVIQGTSPVPLHYRVCAKNQKWNYSCFCVEWQSQNLVLVGLSGFLGLLG